MRELSSGTLSRCNTGQQPESMIHEAWIRPGETPANGCPLHQTASQRIALFCAPPPVLSDIDLVNSLDLVDRLVLQRLSVSFATILAVVRPSAGHQSSCSVHSSVADIQKPCVSSVGGELRVERSVGPASETPLAAPKAASRATSGLLAMYEPAAWPARDASSGLERT